MLTLIVDANSFGGAAGAVDAVAAFMVTGAGAGRCWGAAISGSIFILVTAVTGALVFAGSGG
jgi:hypothetical protein